MDRPRVEKDKYDITQSWNLKKKKMIAIKLFTKQTLRDFENKLMVTKGER